MKLMIYVWSWAWIPTVPAPIWIAAGVLGWLVLAVAVAGWLARTVRRRDRQVPTESVVDRPEQPDTITSRGDLP